nr:MAG TPA: hypothetical protein [Caudoviricetes sp.]
MSSTDVRVRFPPWVQIENQGVRYNLTPFFVPYIRSKK